MEEAGDVHRRTPSDSPSYQPGDVAQAMIKPIVLRVLVMCRSTGQSSGRRGSSKMERQAHPVLRKGRLEGTVRRVIRLHGSGDTSSAQIEVSRRYPLIHLAVVRLVCTLAFILSAVELAQI